MTRETLLPLGTKVRFRSLFRETEEAHPYWVRAVRSPRAYGATEAPLDGPWYTLAACACPCPAEVLTRCVRPWQCRPWEDPDDAL